MDWPSIRTEIISVFMLETPRDLRLVFVLGCSMGYGTVCLLPNWVGRLVNECWSVSPGWSTVNQYDGLSITLTSSLFKVTATCVLVDTPQSMTTLEISDRLLTWSTLQYVAINKSCFISQGIITRCVPYEKDVFYFANSGHLVGRLPEGNREKLTKWHSHSNYASIS